MKKIFLSLVLGLFILLSSLFLAEKALFLLDNKELSKLKILSSFNLRMWRNWIDNVEPGEKTFLPPFAVIDNKNWNSETKRKSLLERVKYQESKTTKTIDFLTPPNTSARDYSITIDKYGFRTPKGTEHNKKNSFKIFSLGSYATIGLGVEDDQTYSHYLEQNLIKKRNDQNIEVWNGGAFTATSIVGLARLKHQILKYDPKVLIWDFGFVDTLLWGEDDYFPVSMYFPNNLFLDFLARSYIENYEGFKNSVIVSKVMSKIYPVSNFLGNTQRQSIVYKELTNEMLRFCKENKIKVILLYQRLIRDEFIIQKDEGDVVSVMVKDAFQLFKPSKKDLSEFNQSTNWTHEFSPALLKEDKLRPHVYFKNLYHPSKYGHKAIADHLANIITNRKILD